jgi:hypothetical protein
MRLPFSSRCIKPAADETALRVGISAVRKALGPGGDRYIATVPARGYCFVLDHHPSSPCWILRVYLMNCLWPPLNRGLSSCKSLSKCHLGGRRPWFKCQTIINGEVCGRRVAKLYAPCFECRQCMGLGYASQREIPLRRAGRRAQMIKMRLEQRPCGAVSAKAARNALANAKAAPSRINWLKSALTLLREPFGRPEPGCGA